MIKKLKSGSALICLAVALTFFISPLNAADKTAPNFIIFYMDDLSWAQTSVRMMDSEPESISDFYHTPGVERLAERGMRFTNGYCPTPTCTGSRISIQFGKTSARMQYRFVHDVLSKKQRPNGYTNEVSIAGVLKESGRNYISAHFGKGVGVEQLKSVGYDVTDEFEVVAANGNLHGDKVDIKSRAPLPVNNPKRIYSLTESSVNFVREHAGKRPFYMMVSHYAVHVKHAASPAVLARWQKKYDELKNKPTDKQALKEFEQEHNALYGAMLEEADANLGLLMDELEKAGELENTYIVFTSDNGSESIRRDEEGYRFCGPLKEGKYSTFEGGLRVPFVVAGPGIKPGSQCDVPVVQWDLLPTFSDLAGSKAQLPESVDGGSLRYLFEQGNNGTVTRGAPGLVFHFPSYYQPPISVIRIGDYKFMRHMNSNEIKLFNVKDDYREQYDLAKSMPEKTAEMDLILRNYITEVNGADVKEVYQAFFEGMDNFEQRAELKFQKEMDELEKQKPVDIDVQRNKLQKELEEKKLGFDAKRKRCKAQMTWPSWYNSAKESTSNLSGINKQSNTINKK
jgi:arylsulfatase A-like enzyme